MTENDREAKQLAIDLTLAENDPDRVAQVQSMLAERDWAEVGSFCAYHQQRRALNLKPWETPPMYAELDGQRISMGDLHRMKPARKLLRKMLDAGVSRSPRPDCSAQLERSLRSNPATARCRSERGLDVRRIIFFAEYEDGSKEHFEIDSTKLGRGDVVASASPGITSRLVCLSSATS